MSKINFSKGSIEKLAPRPKRYNVFDSQTRGLGIAVYPSGVKTFFHLRKVQGWPERTTIGPFPDLSVENARGKASELNGKFARWKEHDYEGPSPLEKPKKAPTLGEVLTDYVENHLKANAKNPERAVKSANWIFDRYFASLRNRTLGTIRRQHVRELHKYIAENHGGVSANRAITFLRTLINHAIHPDVALWDGANPCAKPKKFLAHEESRTRVITREESPKFFKALAEEPHRDLRDFLLLALATGARRGTIFAMRWEEIDWEHAIWVISNPKGKKGRSAHPLPLTRLALSVLKSRQRRNEWVFPGKKMHITTVKKPWRLFLSRAGIQGLTLHDLRRTLASQEGEIGASTEVIQKTLGHKESSAATRIYDRSDRRDEVRGAMDAAMRAMLAAGKTSRKKLLKAGALSAGAP